MSEKLRNLEDLLSQKLAALEKLLAAGKERELDEGEVEQVEAYNGEIDTLKASIDLENRRISATETGWKKRDEVTKRTPKDGTGLPGTAVVDRVHESALDSPTWTFKHAGEYFGAVRSAFETRGMSIDPRLKIGAAITGMGTTVNPDGGFACPPAFNTAIWDEVNVDGMDNLVSQTDMYNVSGRSLTFLANAETSRATGSRYGGIQGYRVQEGGTLTASKPTLREMTIKPSKIAVLAYMTEELMEQEQSALGSYLTRAAGAEIQWIANNEIINGTGAAQMVGILTAGCTVSVAKETGQAATTINSTNIDKMWSRCHPRARSRSVWYINIDCETQLQALERKVGTAGVPAYMPPGGLSAAPYGTLKGRPVVPVEWCQTLGTVGDIILADLGFYATAVRGGVRSESSIHVAFLTDQTAFRFLYQIGGQPWLASAITPANGTNTLSPFVTLATRS